MSPQPRHRPLRVLIADDHPGYARTLGSVLAHTPGIEISGVAVDGVEAVELALGLRPDVVVLDVNMPRLDGFGAARRIRRELPGTRVVIVTGAPEPGGFQRAFEVGAARYLAKDCGVDDLLGAVTGRARTSAARLAIAGA